MANGTMKSKNQTESSISEVMSARDASDTTAAPASPLTTATHKRTTQVKSEQTSHSEDAKCDESVRDSEVNVNGDSSTYTRCCVSPGKVSLITTTRVLGKTETSVTCTVKVKKENDVSSVKIRRESVNSSDDENNIDSGELNCTDAAITRTERRRRRRERMERRRRRKDDMKSIYKLSMLM